MHRPPARRQSNLYLRRRSLAQRAGAAGLESAPIVSQGIGSGVLRRAPATVQVTAVVFGLLYLLFSASSARYFDPGLRAETRSVPVSHTQSRPKRETLGKARTRSGLSPFVRAARKIRRKLVQAWGVCMALCALPMPAGRPPGEDALGVSLPRRRRSRPWPPRRRLRSASLHNDRAG
jgi:hypothetical protein